MCIIFHYVPINFDYLSPILLLDYAQEQEMEIEALEAILMDDFKGWWRIYFNHNAFKNSKCFLLRYQVPFPVCIRCQKFTQVRVA